MLELRIAKPCDQTWTAMRGDDRVRHCSRCDKNVYNVSEMTEAEVEALIQRTEGRFCARLYRRTDNRVMTKDCPRGVAAVRRKRALALTAMGATMAFGYSLVRPASSGAVAAPIHREAEYKAIDTSTSNELHLQLGEIDYPALKRQLSHPSVSDNVDRLPLQTSDQ